MSDEGAEKAEDEIGTLSRSEHRVGARGCLLLAALLLVIPGGCAVAGWLFDIALMRNVGLGFAGAIALATIHHLLKLNKRTERLLRDIKAIVFGLFVCTCVGIAGHALGGWVGALMFVGFLLAFGSRYFAWEVFE